MSRPLALAMSLALLASCDGRPRAGSSGVGDTARQPRTGPALAIFDLSAGVPEQDPSGLLSGPRKQSFYDLVKQAAAAASDTNVKGLLVRFGGASMGLARATELADALEAVRATKPVYCHAEGYSNATLYAAARSCTKIFVSPAGGVDAVGIAAQVVYMRKLLADKLDLTIDFLQVGRFKGAEEPITRDGPSEEARASLEGTLADLRDTWLDGIRKGRAEAPPDAAEDGPYSPERAVERKLVDDVGYVEEARDAARKASGAVRDELRFGSATSGAREADVSDLVRVLASENDSAPVALVRATGSISMSSGGGILGTSGGITERDLGRLLARIEHDDDVKALVLRIDSPGGSALASDLLWHALMRIREKKPIVISVGEMAASGGYYLASTGTVIFADATSIVGSIGVVGGKIGFGKALEKLGVHAEVFPAKRGDAKSAARASYESPLTAWDDATRERVKETMTGIYQLFLERVVAGRAGKLTRAKLEESAEGRIFSGREGKARGLVDEIGGIAAAIAKAKELAKLAPDVRVAVLGQRAGLLDGLLGGGGDGADERAALVSRATEKPRLSDLVGEVLPEVAPFVAGLAPLVRGERALVTLPFALVVR